MSVNILLSCSASSLHSIVNLALLLQLLSIENVSKQRTFPSGCLNLPHSAHAKIAHKVKHMAGATACSFSMNETFLCMSMFKSECKGWQSAQDRMTSVD